MKSNYIQKPIIIIGMHRSGTSMVADSLNDAGICMGVFREHNGEALHFLSLNQQMLTAAQADWLNPRVIEDFNLGMNAHQLYAEHIKSRFATPWRLRLCANHRWGWKDPRNTFTIDFWMKIFPQAKILHVLRDGRAVAQSLYNRNQVAGEVHHPSLNDPAFCFRLWEMYVAQAMKVTEQHNASTIKYEDLLAGDGATLHRLKNVCGVEPKFYVKKNFAQKFDEVWNNLARQSEMFAQAGYELID